MPGLPLHAFSDLKLPVGQKSRLLKVNLTPPPPFMILIVQTFNYMRERNNLNHDLLFLGFTYSNLSFVPA